MVKNSELYAVPISRSRSPIVRGKGASVQTSTGTNVVLEFMVEYFFLIYDEICTRKRLVLNC
jgi:hypothetical protein